MQNKHDLAKQLKKAGTSGQESTVFITTGRKMSSLNQSELFPSTKKLLNLILVYALWKSKNGGFGFEVMSKEDIDNHARRFSQSFGSSYSPWKTNYEEMAKKTVIKKCLKYAPLKTDFVMQMNNDESIKSEINVDMSEVVNEQEDPNIIDQEYKEVENEQSEQ